MSKSYCFGCGADLEDDAKVCPKCGRSLEEVIPPPVPEVVYEARPEPKKVEESPAAVDEALADEKREEERPQFDPKRFIARKIVGVLFVVNGLVGLDIFVRYLYECIKKKRDLSVTIVTLVLDILFLIAVILGNRIMKERKPVRGEVIVKQRSSNKRKIAGALILLPIAAISAYLFYETIDDLRYAYLSIDDIFEMLTIDLLCLSYLWIGISMFFPRTVIKEAPADGENTDTESEGVEK